MNVRLLSLAILLPCISLSGQLTPSSDRQIIAAQWLEDLCVIQSSEWPSISRENLSTALHQWINIKQLPGQCILPAKSTTDSEKASEDKPINLSTTRLIPGFADRFFRTLDFQTEFQQTPDYVYGIPQNAPSGTTSTFLPNPDHIILGFSGPIHLDELFVTTDTRVALCTAINPSKLSTSPETSEIISPDELKIETHNANLFDNCSRFEYLSAQRKRDYLGRIANAISLNVGFSQAPKVESGIVISEQFSDFQHWNPTISGSFDPSKLFRSASETQKLLAYIQNRPPKDYSATSGDELHACDKSNRNNSQDIANCIQVLAMGRKDHQLLIAIIPTLSVKVTTPFDMAKYGTIFLDPPSHAGQPLYDVSLRWNLQRVIPSAATNAQALTALIKKPEDNVNTNLSCQQIIHDWKRRVKMLFFELKLDPQKAEDNVWWSMLESAVMEKPLASKACAETNNSQK